MSEALFNISFEELCQLEGIEDHHIVDIVEYGIVTPIGKNVDFTEYEQWLFDTGATYWVKKALRLKQDLEIDWVAIAMVIRLMKKNEVLEQENERYQRLLGRFTEN